MLGFEKLLEMGVQDAQTNLHWYVIPDSDLMTQNVLVLTSLRRTSRLFVLVCLLNAAFIALGAFWGAFYAVVMAVILITYILFFEFLQPHTLEVKFKPSTDEMLWKISYRTRVFSRRVKISSLDSFELLYQTDWRGRAAGMFRLFVTGPRQRLLMTIPSFGGRDEAKLLAESLRAFIGWSSVVS